MQTPEAFSKEDTLMLASVAISELQMRSLKCRYSLLVNSL